MDIGHLLYVVYNIASNIRYLSSHLILCYFEQYCMHTMTLQKPPTIIFLTIIYLELTKDNDK